jgi:hypothetical protein|uniref:Uncharacterized protein n=1 Tax=Siphoviridae sp. ctqPo10 TaxID=2827948 RepID=A0A8S5SUI4_9CAUD|nr:MAG TPA: hypothetical protein [Siphoviridae sp. ctqPo10]
MKDIKIAKFVELITNSKTAIEAARESGISHLPMGEVLRELSKEEYISDWDKLAKSLIGESKNG